jgi:hypothetical protein
MQKKLKYFLKQADSIYIAARNEARTAEAGKGTAPACNQVGMILA